jgi:hypothetical protein
VDLGLTTNRYFCTVLGTTVTDSLLDFNVKLTGEGAIEELTAIGWVPNS